MNIYIRMPSGKIVSLLREATDTVASVKEQIAVTQKIAPSQQSINFKGQSLDDARTLAEYFIQANDMLLMSLKLVEAFDVYIRDMKGKVAIYKVKQTTTVREAKEMVHAKAGMPASQLKMLYAGQHLEDSKTMADYNITQGAQIFLILILQGGRLSLLP